MLIKTSFIQPQTTKKMKRAEHEAKAQAALEAMLATRQMAIDLLTQTHQTMNDLVRLRQKCKMSNYREQSVAHELSDLCRLLTANEQSCQQ